MKIEDIKKYLQEEIQRRIQERKAFTMDGMVQVVNEVMDEYNATPVDDFGGLTPTQFRTLGPHPFDTPQLLRFRADQIDPKETPVMQVLLGIARECGEKGLKLTPRGYLPRKLVHAMLEVVAGEHAFQPTGTHWVHNEDEFPELMMVRHCAMWAGLFRKAKGKLLLTKKGQKLLEEGATGTMYEELFRQACVKWNWGALDGYPPYSHIQTAFVISLRFLWQDGDRFLDPRTHYGKRFLQAFPDMLNEKRESSIPGEGPHVEEDALRAYELRMFLRFAIPFGLVECDPPGANQWTPRLRDTLRVKRSPLFDQFVDFQV